MQLRADKAGGRLARGGRERLWWRDGRVVQLPAVGEHQRYLQRDPGAPLHHRANRRDTARAVIRVLCDTGRTLPTRVRAGPSGGGESRAHGVRDAHVRQSRGGSDRRGTRTARHAPRGTGNIKVDAARAEPARANLAYTSYLLATVRGGSYAEGVGVVLPCYWIYSEVGKELLRLGSPDPRYRRWIATYGAEEYGHVVAEVIAELDRVSLGLSAEENASVTPALQDDEPLRVDVLADGLRTGILASLRAAAALNHCGAIAVSRAATHHLCEL